MDRGWFLMGRGELGYRRNSMMTRLFTILLKEKIEPLLARKGFDLVYERDGLLDYSSPLVFMRFTFDKRENSSNAFVGISYETLVLLDDDILREVFAAVQRIEGVSISQFVDQLVGFFETSGRGLLSGNKEDLQRLLDYQEDGVRNTPWNFGRDSEDGFRIDLWKRTTDGGRRRKQSVRRNGLALISRVRVRNIIRS